MVTNEGNVAIGYICGDSVDSEFVQSLLSLTAQRGSHIKGRVIQTRGFSGRLDVGRHMVAQIFMDRTDADYLLMLDSDIVFTVEDYDELLRASTQAAEPSIVSGVYPREDGSLCVYDLTDEGYRLTDPTNLMHTKFYEAGAVGMGFCMIPRVVLEELNKDTDTLLPWFDQTIDGPGRLADDTSFCYRCSDIGVPVYVDTQVQVGHVKTAIMMPKLESRLEVAKP